MDIYFDSIFETSADFFHFLVFFHSRKFFRSENFKINTSNMYSLQDKYMYTEHRILLKRMLTLGRGEGKFETIHFKLLSSLTN